MLKKERKKCTAIYGRKNSATKNWQFRRTKKVQNTIAEIFPSKFCWKNFVFLFSLQTLAKKRVLGNRLAVCWKMEVKWKCHRKRKERRKERRNEWSKSQPK